MSVDPQKLCGILLAAQDAAIRVTLTDALAAGESARFTLVLQDLYRTTELVGLAEAVLVAGGPATIDLPVQSKAGGLALAYAGDGFARLALRWGGSVGAARNGTAQLVIVGATHAFPALPLAILPIPLPPLPAPNPPPLTWILGRGLTGLDPTPKG
jgi:hypothetical protein